MQTGDENAFKEIYELTKRNVFFITFSIVKDYSLAEDLMQETYIKIRQNINYYRLNSNANGWILTIARNLAINAFNKRKRDVVLSEDSVQFLTDNNIAFNNLLLTKLLTQLNDNERQVVMLYSLGYKHHEIAKELHKPLGTILWTYNVAINKLKKLGGANEK